MISIVIPAFNESDSLPKLLKQLYQVLKQHYKGEHEVWLIDDGSKDDTYAVINNLHSTYENLHYVQFRRNYGKAAALMEGFARVRGNYVVTMDADLQDDPEEIPSMISALKEGYDLVSGWKRDRKDPLSKKLPSRLFNAVTRWTTGIKIHDFNCGLKAYRKDVVKGLNIYGELHRYIPVLAHFMGFSVTEKPVKHHPRLYGETKYGIARFFRGFFDFITILFLSRYTERPMHFFGMGGLILTMLGMAINIYLAVYWFLGGTLSNRPLLFLGILLVIVGVQLFSIGLLSEMLAYSNRDQKQPRIKTILPK